MQRVGFFSTPSLAQTADSAENSPIIEAIFAETPFYGESGGQVGDRGRVLGGRDFEGDVIDVQKPVPDLIVAHIRPKKGTLQVGTSYTQETDREVRALTARNHTATHLIHWALRKVLGTHVKQAGSLVAPDLLRFDFTHFQPMTEAELTEVENLVNDKIWVAAPVAKQELEKEKAIAAGAIAFFGEKYGDRVRVISVGDFSVELCGGTHVDNSSEIHLFKIGSESGIAAGVRRIVAYTSRGAFDYLRAKDTEVKTIRDRLKASSSDEILGKIDKLMTTEKELRKQIEQFQAKSASGEVDDILAKASSLGGARLVTAICVPDSQGVKRLRDISDKIKQKSPESVAILGMKDPENGRASLLVAVGPKAPKGLNANELLQSIAPLIEGRGGGKPDLAQAGGAKADGLPEALTQAKTWLEKKLSS
jgi:alanyl-tRNA synthetase